MILAVLDLILFFVFVLIANFPLIYYLKKKKDKDYFRRSNEEALSRLGCSIRLNGERGTGKTTLLAYMANSYERINYSKIIDELEEIKNKFYFFDFNYIDDCLLESFCKTAKINHNYKNNIVDSIFNYFSFNNGFYNNFLNNVELKKLMFYYVDNFYILQFRNTNILTTAAIYSTLTNSFAKLLNEETINIKQFYSHKKFYVGRYMILVEDEKSLKKGNGKSNNAAEKNKGGKEFQIILRNGFKETVRYISAKQISDDEIKNERVLSTDNLVIKENNTFNNYGYLISLVKILKKKHLNRLSRHFYKRCNNDKAYAKKWHNSFENYRNSVNNTYRKTEYFYQNCVDYLMSLGSKKFVIHNYKNLTKLNSDIEKDYDLIELSFDVKEAYGLFDTNEYEGTIDYLMANSDVCVDDIPRLPIFKNDVFKDYISSFLFETEEVEKKEKKEKKEVIDLYGNFFGK